MKKPVLKICNLNKKFSTDKVIFEDFNLTITEKNTAILGPNGSGKTTLLRILSGLDTIYDGEICFDNFSRNKDIKIGYAFQDPAKFLFPWMNSFKNIIFPLSIKDERKDKSYHLVKTILKDLSLTIPLDLYPYQLSTGQCQLLVFLRAIIDSPDILLLDEPFSNLDYLNRTKLLFNLINTQNNYSSAIFVSHTLEEAILFADELILLGGSPAQIIKRVKIPFKQSERKPEILNSKQFNDIKWETLESLKQYII